MSQDNPTSWYDFTIRSLWLVDLSSPNFFYQTRKKFW